MSNFLVVNGTQQDIAQGNDKAILGFRSVLPVSTVTGANEDALYPFTNAIDYRDNTKYSPSVSNGTIVIEFTQSLPTEINYFAFAIHNSQDAVLTGALEVDSGDGYEEITGFSIVKNNRPFVHYFGNLSSSRQRLTLNFTNKLYIGAINIGRAVVMRRPPSLGFQPAKTASLDKVEQFTTEGNNFIVGRRLNRGFQAKGQFRFVSFNDDINDWFEDYMDHVLDSKTLFFKWNESKDESVYGLQNPKSLTKPTYKTSFHSDFAFEINGYA